MSVSKSANKFNALSAGEIIAVFAIGIGLHLIFLFITYALFRRSCWKLPLAERKAAVILSSQKTLPVALSVISFLPLALGAHGLMALPCIISHFCQIVMDGFVAASWAEVVDDTEQDKELVDSKYSTTELENVEVVVGKKEEAVNNM
jgi:predicted Na+-dependent transporter